MKKRQILIAIAAVCAGAFAAHADEIPQNPEGVPAETMASVPAAVPAEATESAPAAATPGNAPAGTADVSAEIRALELRLNAQAQDFEKLLAELSALRERLAAQNAEIAAQKDEIAAQKTEIEAQKNALAEAEKLVRENEEKLRAANAEALASANANFSEIRAEISAQKTELEARKTEIAAARSALVSADAENFSALSAKIATGEAREREDAEKLLAETAGLRAETEKLRETDRNLREIDAKLLADGNAAIMRLDAELKSLKFEQKTDRNELAGTIKTAEESGKAALAKRSAAGAITAILLVVAGAIAAAVLSKKIRLGGAALGEVCSTQAVLAQAQKALQEESLKLDSKLLEIVEKQLAAAVPAKSVPAEPDHSLVLKVADEIARIEKNLSRMDSSVKGHKQLAAAVRRVKDNFLSNGYEIVEMLGKTYNDGINCNATFIADETLPEGARIITGITKPQVNFNGKLIQAAVIAVSQNI